MLINDTFFTKKIQIPNLGTGQGKFNINHLIEQKCYSFLHSLLGNDIYSELKQHFDDDLNLKQDAPQKFKDLLFGKEYDNKIWKGLIEQGKFYKFSILANYVFLAYIDETSSLTTNQGQVNIDIKNAEKVSSKQISVDVWNEIVSKVGEKRPYKAIISNINGVRFVDWYGNNNNTLVNLTDFLNDFKEIYPNPTLLTPEGYNLYYKNTLDL